MTIGRMGNRISSRVPNTNFLIFGSGRQHAAVRLPRQTLKDFLFVVQSFVKKTKIKVYTWMKRIRLNAEFSGWKLDKGRTYTHELLLLVNVPQGHGISRRSGQQKIGDGMEQDVFYSTLMDASQLTLGRRQSLWQSTLWNAPQFDLFFLLERNGKWHS